MKNLFYFIFGVLCTLLAALFGLEHYGEEFIQDYWIEQLWYGELSQPYEIVKASIIMLTLINVIVWTYMQGKDAAHLIEDDEFKDNNNNPPTNSNQTINQYG